MRRAICTFSVGATFAFCAASLHSGELAVFDSGEIAVSFDKRHFEKVELNIIPKCPGRASPEGATGPKRRVLTLRHQPRSAFKGAGRYYYPSSSAIYVTPLFDSSVKEFAAAYPSLHENALGLRKLLLLSRREFEARAEQWKHPDPVQVPDEPFSNAGACLLAHYKRLNQPRCTGYRMLTYYRNGSAGYGAINAELQYQYQGFTRDERFFITAKLAVRHDLLPDSIDDARAASDETPAEQLAERKGINRWKEDSFLPPLTVLDAMIGSLHIGPKS
jgi:hypothetical protein